MINSGTAVSYELLRNYCSVPTVISKVIAGQFLKDAAVLLVMDQHTKSSTTNAENHPQDES